MRSRLTNEFAQSRASSHKFVKNLEEPEGLPDLGTGVAINHGFMTAALFTAAARLSLAWRVELPMPHREGQVLKCGCQEVPLWEHESGQGETNIW